MTLRTPVWLVDGEAKGLAPADRGLAYGDGLFETMAAWNGQVRRLELHMERLAEGCRRLRIPLDAAGIEHEILSHCPPRGRYVIKLIVTGGAGLRGYRIPQPRIPTTIIGISDWPDHPLSHYTQGVRVASLDFRLGRNPALAGMKHLCRLEQVLAGQELSEKDAEEGVLLDERGLVVSGVACNLFMVRDGGLLTPDLSHSGVCGVMRRAVLERATRLGVRAATAELHPADLQRADEIFLTNAVFGIWPVRQLDTRSIRVGDLTRTLMRELDCVDECVDEDGKRID